MGYFDACEACGQSESLVVDGLCHRCARLEQRAAFGTSTLPRVSGLLFKDRKVVTRLATTRREPDVSD